MCFLYYEVMSLHSSSFACLAALRELTSEACIWRNMIVLTNVIVWASTTLTVWLNPDYYNLCP